MAVRTTVTEYTHSGTDNIKINDLLSLYATETINTGRAGSKYGGAIGTGSGVITYTTSGNVSSTQLNMLTQAANLWASVANVQFASVRSKEEANVYINNSTVWKTEEAHAEFPAKPYAEMEINLSGSHAYQLNPTTTGDKQMAQANILHEMGHLLGLAHPHDTKVNDTFIVTEPYSVMSYIRYLSKIGASSKDNANIVRPSTPMLDDIAAVQHLYGANYTYNTGDTRYDSKYFGGTNAKFIKTIYDAGGVDTIDLSDQVSAVVLNLNPGTYSWVGNMDFRSAMKNSWAVDENISRTIQGPGNLAMAYEVKNSNGDVVNYIENAIGTRGNDVIMGNNANNVIAGGAGNDQLFGDNGRDTLTGGAGADKFMISGNSVNLGNVDTITDFATTTDKIYLSTTLCAALKKLVASDSVLPSTYFAQDAAKDSNDFIVYQSKTGGIYYDDDGSGAHAAQLIADVTDGLKLNNSHFYVFAA